MSKPKITHDQKAQRMDDKDLIARAVLLQQELPTLRYKVMLLEAEQKAIMAELNKRNL